MDKRLNRRRFLGAAIGTGVAVAGTGSLAPAAPAAPGSSSGRVPSERRGIQLWTMRRVMDNSQDDARRVLRWLGRAGYTEVEPYWRFEWTPQQFRAELDSAGLRVLSSHDGLDIDPAGTTWRDSYRQNLEYAAELGQEYTGLSWYPPPYTEERFRQIAERMNEAGALAHEYGLQFLLRQSRLRVRLARRVPGRRPGRQAHLHRARRAATLPPRRRGRRVHDRPSRDRLFARRAVVAAVRSASARAEQDRERPASKRSGAASSRKPAARAASKT
jgi:Xylose isomerase-like TIM barrel